MYKISKEVCEKKIRGVCEGCGGKLSAIETIDNSGDPTYWQGCEHCRCFRSGVERRVFEIARKLVESGEMVGWNNMRKCDYEKSSEGLIYYFDAQTAALSQKIARIAFLLKENDHDHP